MVTDSQSTVHAHTRVLARVRYGLSILLFVLGFSAALLFYGSSYNLLFAWVASCSAVAALLLAGPARFASAWLTHPVAVPFAVLIIVLLFVQHTLFAQSAETSYPLTWILASAPLWCLVWLCWGKVADSESPSLHFLVALGMVAVLAVLALVRFVGWGVRPHDPLVDASGFGILMYLAWVPATHYWLVSAVSGRHHRWRLVDGCMLLAALIVLVVIFATVSLACTGLVAAALLAWAIVALRGGLCWRRLLALIIAAGVAYGYSYAQSPALQTSMDGELAQDGATEQRVLLAEAALELVEHGSWHGTGLFSFATGYAAIRTTADQTSDGSFVHNDYLQLLVEGGVWLFVPIVVFAVLVALRSLTYLLPIRLPGFAELLPRASLRAGGWFALGMVCVHMLVNFVWYTMALATAIGVVAAWACTGSTNSRAALAVSGRALRWWIGCWILGAGLGIYGLGLLMLDSMSASVFAGQPSLFGSANYRRAGTAQVAFAVQAERINGHRATPVLAQALYAKALVELPQITLSEQVEQAELAAAKFEQALLIDPWNLAAYLGYAEFLEHLEASALSPPVVARIVGDRDPVELLEQVLRRDPRNLDALAALARSPGYRDNPQALYRMLQTRFYPWLPTHWRQSRQDAEQWLNRLAVLSNQLSDASFFATLRADRARLIAQKELKPYKAWFIRWQQRNAQGG